jgi:hypothetical protein
MRIDFEFRISNFEFRSASVPTGCVRAEIRIPKSAMLLNSADSFLGAGWKIRNSKFEIRNYCKYVERYQ